jgi:hypothetical protein
MANPSSRTVTSQGNYMPAFLNIAVGVLLSLVYLPSFFDPKMDPISRDDPKLTPDSK